MRPLTIDDTTALEELFDSVVGARLVAVRYWVSGSGGAVGTVLEEVDSVELHLDGRQLLVRWAKAGEVEGLACYLDGRCPAPNESFVVVDAPDAADPWSGLRGHQVTGLRVAHHESSDGARPLWALSLEVGEEEGASIAPVAPCIGWP